MTYQVPDLGVSSNARPGGEYSIPKVSILAYDQRRP